MKTVNWGPAAALSFGFALAACGGGGGDDSSAAPVTVSGVITFDRVPVVFGIGLDYAHTLESPVRAATVELISGTTVLASATTDDNGAYSLSVAPGKTVFLRAKAEMVRGGTPSWTFRVVDNTHGDALYVLDGPAFNTGSADSTRNLRAPSGWDGTAYTGERSAAPFAILDTVYDAAAEVVAADPSVHFAPLALHWSVNNRPYGNAENQPDPATGEIVTSFFSPDLGGIFLLGAADIDTDEYDRDVILHEWAHYFEHALSRSDSIAGPHARNDELDMRTAFSEGWGNAFSGIVSGDPVYTDVNGTGQRAGFSFDVETPLQGFNLNPGWYSEESIQEILYDLVDTNMDGVDSLSLSFGALYAVFRGPHREGRGLTSIFTFISALKAADAAAASLIDALVTNQAIDSIVDPYGSNQTSNGGNPPSDNVLPIYTPLMVGGLANVCSTDEFRSDSTGSTNKLGSRRFLKFSVASPGTYTFTAIATDVPAGNFADPDLVLHSGDLLERSEASPTDACKAAPLGNCREQFATTLTPADYVLEVYEWTNTQPDSSVDPPIGLTCFDVSVTQ